MPSLNRHCSRRLILALAVMFATAVASACGGNAHPPDLTVSAGESSVTAGIGSYCWGGGSRGVCVDTGVITQVVPLQATGQPTLVAPAPKVTLNHMGAQAWPLSGLDLTDNADKESLSWSYEELGEGRRLDVAEEEGELRTSTAKLEPGLYVIELFLDIEGAGDVSYGVLLDLAPPAP